MRGRTRFILLLLTLTLAAGLAVPASAEVMTLGVWLRGIRIQEDGNEVQMTEKFVSGDDDFSDLYDDQDAFYPSSGEMSMHGFQEIAPDEASGDMYGSVVDDEDDGFDDSEFEEELEPFGDDLPGDEF